MIIMPNTYGKYWGGGGFCLRWSTHSVENITFFSGTRKHKHIQKLTFSTGCKETHCTNNKISAEFACQAHLPNVNNASSPHINLQKKVLRKRVHADGGVCGPSWWGMSGFPAKYSKQKEKEMIMQWAGLNLSLRAQMQRMLLSVQIKSDG